jgi:hypothetical protein
MMYGDDSNGGIMGVRTTIQLDEELMERVRQLVPARGFNQFVKEAVAARVATIERERIEREMMEGYIAQREEREEMNRDWEHVDIEGWPE